MVLPSRTVEIEKGQLEMDLRYFPSLNDLETLKASVCEDSVYDLTRLVKMLCLETKKRSPACNPGSPVVAGSTDPIFSKSFQ